MTTFADINSFDWSSMLSDIQQQRSTMNSTATNNNQFPMSSTIQPKQEFFAVQQQQQQLTQQPSPVSSDDNDMWFDNFLAEGENQSNNSSSNTTTTTSPLEFSSLFDVDDKNDDRESLFSSTVTSLDNTPLIKAEEMNQQIPNMDLSDVQHDAPSSTTTTPASTETKKPKKKRAPRKRLTAHQKQAHNKIEKRYRININAKIAGLQQIIPWVASEKTAFETGDGIKIEQDGEVPRLNKSMILEKATAYILHLQESDVKLKEENEKLRREVERLGGNVN
ncbi:hypothetical protein WICANDRAFT_63824 [Wickerhamomyces anomalus NRRL Y-366-8]|uniref:BHLH domain-containing protein n=1 Tax=Wickerhamomyces anomalus (strain ATCC 58044 / CBS 1984 / NCYC 433 / NRRL Y-366-8) TaxID=683960 RepID=A0A1E3P1W9_WICAA|nr:uncharacterized protein WICANDRAFT_63824 [Wickerhamomyces anomalus NRRL Y-366-8]ODQ59328.1 hypothetical protein WICANDRAFT_63824 [Wickerhamomyces anomalus NRRL Y-366-8]